MCQDVLTWCVLSCDTQAPGPSRVGICLVTNVPDYPGTHVTYHLLHSPQVYLSTIPGVLE